MLKSLVSVRPDLGLAVTKLISFILDKVAADGCSMVSMYIDCGFNVSFLATYPGIGVTALGIIDALISIYVAHHRQASAR
jgi:hypothetical protein